MATIPGWSQAKAIGTTREAAIAQLQQWVIQQIPNEPSPQANLSQLKVDLSPRTEHPSTKFATTIAQNPLFNEMLEEVGSVLKVF
jgi:hypothetical protein